MNLNHQNTAKVGDRIRAYDFQGRKDCYIEGKVTEIPGDGTFRIEVDADCWPFRSQNPKTRIGMNFVVPMQVMFMEYPERIINLTENPQAKKGELIRDA